MSLSRRSALALAAAAGAGGLAGCTTDAPRSSASTSPASGASPIASASNTTPGATNASATPLPPPEPLPQQAVTPWPKPNVKVGKPIGDGSQAPATAPQPFQRPITKLKKDETPPQFVVFSWDGASGNQNYILDYVEAAHAVQGTMTLFSSGLYFLPKSKASEYHPPKNPVGASDIPYLSDKSVERTIRDTGIAWTYGNEIGTHFCGHFGDPKTGVAAWSVADWEQELAESMKFVQHWRTNTGWTQLNPLPFDYSQELVGARTPQLAGSENWCKVAARHGFRYDSSSARAGLHWPKKDANGLWNMSMFDVPFRDHRILPMDYNFYAEQAKATDGGTDADRAAWKAEHADTLRRGLRLCLEGSRAPFFIGNHLSRWQNGIYQDNLLTLITEFGRVPGVQLVSHRWLCDWLDAQDAAVLADLQAR